MEEYDNLSVKQIELQIKNNDIKINTLEEKLLSQEYEVTALKAELEEEGDDLDEDNSKEECPSCGFLFECPMGRTTCPACNGEL